MLKVVYHFYFLACRNKGIKNKREILYLMNREAMKEMPLKNLSCWAGSHGAKLPPGLKSLEAQTSHLDVRHPWARILLLPFPVGVMASLYLCFLLGITWG